MPVKDSWIAATALALGVAVVTQDDDFPVLGALHVIRCECRRPTGSTEQHPAGT